MDPMDLCECPFEERRSQQSLFFSPVEMNAVGSPTGRVQHEPAEASVIAARRTSAKSHRGIIMAAIAGHSVTSREAARFLPVDRDGNPQNSNRAASRLQELWEEGRIAVQREQGHCVLGSCHPHSKPTSIHLPMAPCDVHGRPIHRDGAAIWVAV